MFVKRFAEWCRSAPVEDRVLAVSQVCAAYRLAPAGGPERASGAAVMTVALDDPSPSVRLALAEGLADCADAPRHLLLALARDVPAVAAPILLRSPALADADLVSLVRGGDAACALAVSGRPSLSAPLARAIVECGDAAANARLMDNATIVLGPEALARLASRFAEDAAIRSRLLRAPNLPERLRGDLERRHHAALCDFVARSGWMTAAQAETLRRRMGDEDFLRALADARGESLDRLLDAAVREERLTPSLLLRAGACGRLDVLERSLALLARTLRGRVSAAFCSRGRSALEALWLRAGIDAEVGRLLALAWHGWRAAPDGTVSTRRHVLQTLRAASCADARPAIARLICDLELDVEREAALEHRETLLLAA